MNARNQQLQLTVECRQIRDVTLCAFHTILLHRSVGKFKYTSDVNYTLGSIGVEEIDCDEIDLTYVRVNSPELVSDVDIKVRDFADAIQAAITDGYFLSGSSPHSSPGQEGRLHGIDRWENLFGAQIRLEFYQRRKRKWPIQKTINEDFYRMREFVGEKLSESVLSVCETVNKPQYLPKMPTRSELPDVYDDRFSDCHPYLYRVESDYGSKLHENASKASFMKKLFLDTLTFTS
uniref:Autophagy-related protein 101 n=1 Tax=Ditylenchus dipsaci TaxID=166011 RepID=A0A915EBR8_9BILA